MKPIRVKYIERKKEKVNLDRLKRGRKAIYINRFSTMRVNVYTWIVTFFKLDNFSIIKNTYVHRAYNLCTYRN